MQSGRCAGEHHLYNFGDLQDEFISFASLQDVQNLYRRYSFNILVENRSMQRGRCAGEL